MKLNINRNIFWTETFVDELTSLGVKYACISPGSRNTPLTLAFAQNKKIKSFVIIDERSCGFFALGLAKEHGSPVAIVCTSGTATAELYPSIIEAYQQRVPLIICTADRPPESLDCGANQTINQNNLYRNHIRWFVDAGLPEPTERRIKHIRVLTRRAVYECNLNSRGPVHLNFPFRKPFEPYSFTDIINEKIVSAANSELKEKKSLFLKEGKNILEEKWFNQLASLMKEKKKGIIIAGPENYYAGFTSKCSELGNILGYPVFADGASQLRCGNNNKISVIVNYDAFVRSNNFIKKYKPELIIHFGRTITSKHLEQYLELCSSPRFMINEFGDWFDPSNKSLSSFACKPVHFCDKMIEHLRAVGFQKQNNAWLNKFISLDKKAESLKEKHINKAAFPSESRIISELFKILPDNSNLMISNSMPVRDIDYFLSKSEKNITLFNNRGASGIDGITSTALGIAAISSKPTFLITGDLAFYHDLNGLLASMKYKIPLVVIVINNNGGGIFEMLPISTYGKIFKDNFITPHDLDFSHFVKGYHGHYESIKNWNHFASAFQKSLSRKKLTVLEFKTNAQVSLRQRKFYWEKVAQTVFEM